MKNLKLNYFIYALIVISFLSYLTIFKIQSPEKINFVILWKIIPNVVTIDTVIIYLFIQFLWKWKIFKGWLVPFPNLNGTYKGTIISSWRDPLTNQTPAPIPTILTIHQSFFSISCVMRTEEMTSHSFISDFLIDQDNQVKKLSYSYSSIPKQVVRERSPQHCGTIVFEIHETPNLRLTGEYWTERKTIGTIELEFWKKEKLTAFPDTLGKHPVSEIRENKY